MVPASFNLSGSLLQGELQIPSSAPTLKNAAGDKWTEQLDSAEEHGHVGPANAARQRHDAWRPVTARGEHASKPHPCLCGSVFCVCAEAATAWEHRQRW